MSWEDEHIDNLFKEAASNQQVDYKEDFWTEFEKTLPEKKQKKRVLGFWWFGTGLVAILAAIFLLDNSSEKKLISNAFSESNNSKNENTETLKEKKLNTIETNSIRENINKNKELKKFLNNTSDETHIYKNLESSQSNYTKNTNEDVIALINQKSDDEINNEVPKELKSTNFEITELSLKPISFFTTSNLLYSNEIKRKTKKWHPYIDVYYSINQSPLVNSDLGSNFSNGYGVGSGILYNSAVFSFSAGLNLGAQNYSNIVINDRAKVYGFGVKNYEQNIKYKSLYLLELPVYAGFNMDKHMLQLGIVSSFVLGTSFHHELKEDGLVTQNENHFNYRKGLGSFYVKPSIKYAFKINKMIQIGAVFQFQLNPILSEVALFKGVENVHPINGQLFIRKTIR